MNIVLTGFMATGKTAVGKMLAGKLGYQYCDTDELIERETKKKISDIFSEDGEPYFRNIETEIVKLISQLDNYVIATGGGVVLRKENMDSLEKKGKGIIVNLKANPETILRRVGKNKDRPLLNKPNPPEEIKKLLQYRQPYYDRCNLSIATDDLSVEQIVEQIMGTLLDN